MMSDFEIVDKDAEVDPCYGLYDFYITKDEITALMCGKKLYSIVNCGEYAITIEMAESAELLKSVVGVDLDLVLKASQFAVYRYIEEGSKMFATDIGTDDCKTIDWVDVINALADLRETIQ